MSLNRQDLDCSDYEIIVINDGSTDQTEDIVLTLSQEIKNLKLISQENKGNGGARNTGIDASTGEYIYFLDADDYIADNVLGKLVSILDDNNLDMLGFSTKHVMDSMDVISNRTTEKTKELNLQSGIDFIGSHNYEAEVWWYISRRDFFIATGLRFYDRKFVQDSYLTPTLFSKAKRVAYIPLDVHRYRMSNNSITRKKSVDHLKRHFSDLSFSVNKLYKLRKQLVEDGITNSKSLTRLHVKQQRYVFIIIVHFIKSGLPPEFLKKMLKEFRGLEAYPIDKFMTLPDYRSPLYLFLTFIFNRKYLLFPLTHLYNTFKKVKS